MVNLQVLSESGASPRIQKDARTVLSLLQKGRHWVLCCLLMSNVVVNETLPIFLDEIMPGGGFLAVASSSVLIVIFGGEHKPLKPRAPAVRSKLN
jgi:metal transporter CNNM